MHCVYLQYIHPYHFGCSNSDMRVYFYCFHKNLPVCRLWLLSFQKIIANKIQMIAVNRKLFQFKSCAPAEIPPHYCMEVSASAESPSHYCMAVSARGYSAAFGVLSFFWFVLYYHQRTLFDDTEKRNDDFSVYSFFRWPVSVTCMKH
jgi:hypothetical protein